jgi:hypothetical protein
MEIQCELYMNAKKAKRYKHHQDPCIVTPDKLKQ